MKQVLVAALEQEEGNILLAESWRNPEPTEPFSENLVLQMPACVPEEGVRSSSVPVFAYVLGTDVLSRGHYSDEQKYVLCFTICITAKHHKFILTTSIVWLFT